MDVFNIGHLLHKGKKLIGICRKGYGRLTRKRMTLSPDWKK